MYGLGCESCGLGTVSPADAGTVRDPEWTTWVPNWAVGLVSPAEAEGFGLAPDFYVVVDILDPVASGSVLVDNLEAFVPAADPSSFQATARQLVDAFRSLMGNTTGLAPDHPRYGTVWNDPAWVPDVIAGQMADVAAGVPAGSTGPPPIDDYTHDPSTEPPPPYVPETEVYIVNGFRCEFPAGHGPPTPEECELVGVSTSSGGNGGNGNGGGGGGGGGGGAAPESNVPLLAGVGLLGLLLLMKPGKRGK